jgi:putative N-acetylmannosamine-6-phosphate epimerase
MTKIIGFAGRKQSGKTTCSEFVAKYYNGVISPFNKAVIYNFADPLKKDICMNILGLTYDQCYGNDISKNQYTEVYWNDIRLTAREVMQLVGTDIFRKMKKDVWASSTIKKIQKEQPELAIIADCRFPNEVEAIKNAGGLVIKLTRNPYNSSHDSETALDELNYCSSNFDFIIFNDNITIPEQNNTILRFLKNKRVLS